MDDHAREVKFEIQGTRKATSWLAEEQASLAFTTYQTGKLFFIGLQSDLKLSVFERTFNRCMGLYASPDANTLYMSTLYQLIRFEQAFDDNQTYKEHDRLYVPQLGYFTGDIDIHDIVVNSDGRPVFVNTLFSCLATVSETHSFIPLWKPPFISKLAAEDRCHLNGLCLDENGDPAYVTSVSQSDVNDGWREKRRDGGIVMDIKSDEIIASGLSMPHSPRWYRGKLWLLDSGSGNFGFIDMKKGRFEPLVFCPGYLRGLVFSGDHAIVGMSQPRGNKTFEDLPLQETLNRKDVEPRCGLAVIDINSGDVVHEFRIGGIVKELYDVVVLKGVKRPMAIGLVKDDIRHVITIGEAGPAVEQRIAGQT